MNLENSKTSEPHLLIIKLTDKLNLRRGEKSTALSFITHGKTLKAHTITINLKYQHQHGMINLNYRMDHALYQMFRIILSIF